MQFYLILIFLLISSCAARPVHNGFEDVEEASRQVTIKVDDKRSILDKIGIPNARSLEGSSVEEWYYIYKTKEYMTFMKPKIKENLVLRLVFDKSGKLTKKELIDNPKVVAHKLRQDKTPTEKGKEGYLKDILGNFGYIDSKKDKDF